MTTMPKESDFKYREDYMRAVFAHGDALIRRQELITTWVNQCLDVWSRSDCSVPRDIPQVDMDWELRRSALSLTDQQLLACINKENQTHRPEINPMPTLTEEETQIESIRFWWPLRHESEENRLMIHWRISDLRMLRRQCDAQTQPHRQTRAHPGFSCAHQA